MLWIRFEESHGLQMTHWNFVLGSKKVIIEGETKNQNVSSPVYPPKVSLNYELLPSLDLSLNQATSAIMRNPLAKPTQQYIALWKQSKADGFIPTASPDANPDLITEATTLREILEKMASLAAVAESEGKIDNKAISSLAGRKLWVIPGAETPMCKFIETGEDIDHLAAIKIDLV